MVGVFYFKLDMSRNCDGSGGCKLVPHVRGATAGPNITEHLRRFQDRESQVAFLKDRFDRLDEMSRGHEPLVPLVFVSQSRFPTYEVDFGWGKPEWMGTAGWIRLNHVLFLDCKDGKGIEANVALKDGTR